MILSKLSNSTLLRNTKELVSQERKISVQILNHLKEIDRRSLHLELGYSSLFDYATKELKYSESQAQRRISAMKLLKVVPALEEKIKQGTINLTTASKIQSFVYQSQKNNTPLNGTETLLLVEKLENKSSKDCELELLKLSPEPVIFKEKTRVLSEEYSELKLILNAKLKEKLDRAKNLLSHKNSNPTQAELIEMLCDFLIQKKNASCISQKKNLTVLSSDSFEEKSIPIPISNPNFEVTYDKNSLRKTEGILYSKKNPSSSSQQINAASKRYIPVNIKRQVFKRDHGHCSYKNSQTQIQCTSQYLLQYDHRTPLSLGGLTTFENLRLLCFQHHKLETEKLFGPWFIQRKF